MISDASLRAYVDAALEGDDVAVAALVTQTQPFVVAACRALGSGDDVDDLVQEVYLRALTALPRFRGESSVRTWLARIARNTCADAVRNRQRRRRIGRRIAAGPPPPAVPDHALGIELDDLVAGLDPDRRDAFVLTQLVGLSYDEAAAVLECPVGTVRSRVARARGELAVLERHSRGA